MGGYSTEKLATVQEYDPATNSWALRASMPTARDVQVVVAATNGKIYAIGGHLNGQSLRTVEVYDPATNTWTTGLDLPTARDNFSSSVVDGTIYAIGGWDGVKSLSTVEAYDTGFAVEAKGKRPTLWGHLKAGG